MFVGESKVLMLNMSSEKADMLLDRFSHFSEMNGDEWLISDIHFADKENDAFWKIFFGEQYPEGGLDQYSYISFVAD